MEPVRVGGTRGGGRLFLFGLVLSALSGWFFVDSVRVTSYGSGLISGGFGGFGGTGSMGILFLPIFLGVVILFFDAKKAAGWVLIGLGIVILGVEILSQLRFFFNLKLSHFLLMLVSFAAGLGLMARALKEDPPEDSAKRVGANNDANLNSPKS